MPAVSKARASSAGGSARWTSKIERYPAYVQDYYLEMRKGEDTWAVMPMPHGPAQFSVVQNFSSSIDFTLGAVPRREHSEPRSWSINISGRSGTVPRGWFNTLSKGDKSASWAPLTVIMTEFNDFLNEYQRFAQDDGSRELSDEHYAFEPQNRWWLIFHALRENKHYAVELVKFVFDRNAAATRNSCEWSLVLEGWDQFADRQTGEQKNWLTYEVADSFASEGRSFSFSDDLMSETTASHWAAVDASAIQAYTKKYDPLWRSGLKYDAAQRQQMLEKLPFGERGKGKLAYTMYELLRGTDLAALGHVGAQLYGVRNQLLAYRQSADALFRQGNALRDIALAPARLIAQVSADMQNVVDAVRALFTGDSVVYADLALYLAAFEAVLVDTVTLYGLLGGTADGLETAKKFSAYVPGKSLPPPAFSPYQSPANAAVGPGVTLFQVPPGIFDFKMLAQYLFDSPDYWLTLAAINGAKDAQSDGNGAPLQPGAKILVPSGVSSSNQAKQNLDAIFGTDFLQGPDGDWVYNQPEYQDSFVAGGDGVKAVSGVANLMQSLLNRMTTKKGDVSTFPQYGMLQAGPGDAVTAATAGWAAIDIRRQMLQDPRLADVKDVEVVFEDTAWHVKFTAVPVGPQPDKVTALVPMQAFGTAVS